MDKAKKCIYIIIGTYIASKIYSFLYKKMMNNTNYLSNIIFVRKKTVQNEMNESAIKEAQSMENEGKFTEAVNFYLYAFKNGYDYDRLINLIIHETTKAIFLSEKDNF